MPTDPPPTAAVSPRPEPAPGATDFIPPASVVAGAGPLPGAVVRDHRTETVVLGDFQLRAKIGTGTQGAVYRAHQISRDRPVALKVFVGPAATRGTLLARFEREAAVLGRLDHPGIVRCFGAGEERGFHYFAMELIEGPNVAALLEQAGGQLSPSSAWHIAVRCAEALGYAAVRHVIHRDVKPRNILIDRSGEVKLTDWGLAKPTDGDHGLTREHTCMGTLAYVAPEQVRAAHRADHRSDIYALGGVLYELLTGRVPFPGVDWLEVLRAKDQGSFPPASEMNPAVPRGCDFVLHRMLAPDPANRYANYDELLDDLNGIGLACEQLELPSAAVRADGSVRSSAIVAEPRLRVLLVYDETDYIPLIQHALHAAGVGHDLALVEDGHQARHSVIRDRGAAGAPGPDVVVLGLTSPTQSSLHVLTELRSSSSPHELLVCGLSKCPDGASLLRTLNLGEVIWVTGFGDLKPLSETLRSTFAGAAT